MSDQSLQTPNPPTSYYDIDQSAIFSSINRRRSSVSSLPTNPDIDSNEIIEEPQESYQTLDSNEDYNAETNYNEYENQNVNRQLFQEEDQTNQLQTSVKLSKYNLTLDSQVYASFQELQHSVTDYNDIMDSLEIENCYYEKLLSFIHDFEELYDHQQVNASSISTLQLYIYFYTNINDCYNILIKMDYVIPLQYHQNPHLYTKPSMPISVIDNAPVLTSLPSSKLISSLNQKLSNSPIKTTKFSSVSRLSPMNIKSTSKPSNQSSISSLSSSSSYRIPIRSSQPIPKSLTKPAITANNSDIIMMEELQKKRIIQATTFSAIKLSAYHNPDTTSSSPTYTYPASVSNSIHANTTIVVHIYI
ncbi:hypothetical protein WA158_000677 [Blastocystis sp. Blastoise]